MQAPASASASAQHPNRSFWHHVSSAIAHRAITECWTPDDCLAAHLQTSLLSYESHPDAQNQWAHYFPSSPNEIRHNAPWNDWIPPSKSYKIFEQARECKKLEPVENRVRVRLCNSADAKGLRDGIIVFARVERSFDGKKFLQLLRGRDVLASMDLTSLQIVQTHELAVAMTQRAEPAPSCPIIFLAFEDTARVTKFACMLT